MNKQATCKQLDRVLPLLRAGYRATAAAVSGVDARHGDLTFVSSGKYLDLYLVIDRAGQVRQRKATFKS